MRASEYNIECWKKDYKLLLEDLRRSVSESPAIKEKMRSTKNKKYSRFTHNDMKKVIPTLVKNIGYKPLCYHFGELLVESMTTIAALELEINNINNAHDRVFSAHISNLKHEIDMIKKWNLAKTKIIERYPKITESEIESQS